MKSFALTSALTASILLVTGCAQFTTSDAEVANLKSIADTRADEYISCVKTEAGTVNVSTDSAFIAQAVGARCKDSLDSYSVAQKEYLEPQYMMTSTPLAASVAELEKRGQTEVAEMLVSRGPATQVAPAPTALPQLTLPVGSVAAASAAAVGAATAWSPEQRVYLDCMDEQADKYVRLNESAEAIATVAATKCRSYLSIERRASLEAEGKAKVMGKIMDQRLAPSR